MTKNVGNLDKGIRIVLAIGASYLYMSDMVVGILGIVLLVVSVVLVLTSLFSFCPLYKMFGISTCKI